MENFLSSGIKPGIRVSRDVGTIKVVHGNGTEPRVISGTRDTKGIGIRNIKAGNGAAIRGERKCFSK
jgi:hypothetical protein